MNSLLGIRNILIKGEFKSDIFSSLCDEISLSLKAQCTADCRIEIVSLNSGSEESIVYDEKYTDCEVSFKYSFDPISLAVYRGAEKFFVRIVSDGEISVLELEIYENNANTGEEDTSSLNNTGIGEDGVKVAYVYDKYGTCSEVHRTPVRVLFIGNSLVFGMGKRYGMCASHPDKDYFHYVSEYIKKYNPVCRFDKLYGSMFEHAESIEAFEHWYNDDCGLYPDKPLAAKTFFSSDTDLILIQLGDNVNTDDKESVFKITKDMLIERLKSACPKARIIWIHGWYNRKRTDEPIKELCDRWKLERIDIGSLRSAATEAHNQKYYYDVNAGEEREVSERWITHPGDLGMRKIADKIIKKLDL